MNPLLTELVWSRWLNYVPILFGVFIDLGPLKTQKKRLGQYTATVTSRLINNAYIGRCRGFRKPWALESGIQLKESRIRLTIGIQVPQTKPIGGIEAHITNSAVWPVESGTSPRRGLGIIQDYLGFPYMGRHRHVYFNEKSDAYQFLRLFSRYHRCRQILRW